MAMKVLFIIGVLFTFSTAHALPSSYKELLDFVQPAPNQAESNTCLFVASTGALELLLNKRDNIRLPITNGVHDLSESFLIFQNNYSDRRYPAQHFIQSTVMKFNHGKAIHNTVWPFVALNSDGTTNYTVWNRHPQYYTLPSVKVPSVKTSLLFNRGRKWARYVLNPADVVTVKNALVKSQAPVIINYVDEGYWHVVLIVGYDDEAEGECYEVDRPEDCNRKGVFFVRDSFGIAYEERYDARAYSWFLANANAAAQVELQ